MTVIKNQLKKLIEFIENVKNESHLLSLSCVSLKKESAPISSTPQDKNFLDFTDEQEIKNYAFIGMGKMREMLKSMEELKESNEDVFNLIKIIDDMTFQTNMLVVNATAEAAGVNNEIIFSSSNISS